MAVTIESLVADDQGVACLELGLGPLEDSERWPECSGPYARIVRHLWGPSGTTRDGIGVFSDRFTWKLEPMIGTIGVVPELEVSSSVSTQGPCGGNIDCRDIKEGTTHYLDCCNDGDQFFVGDVHAGQADTEFTGVADETRAELILQCDIIKNKRIPNSRLEKEDSIITSCSSRPFEDAMRTAMLDLMDWIVTEYGVGRGEAYIQLSVNSDVRFHVYQIVLGARGACTAGVEMPKKYLKRLEQLSWTLG